MNKINDSATAYQAAFNESSKRLSNQVFDNPKEFLQTIRDNFKEMSHNHTQISLADLQEDSTNGSTSKIRAAAKIASEHFSDLDGIQVKQDVLSRSDDYKDEGISKDDVNFALDMNNHKILGYAAEQTVGLGFVAAISAGVGGLGATVGTVELATGDSIFGATAAAVPVVLPALWFGLGAVGIGTAGLAAYASVKSWSEFNKVSNEDATKFKAWLS